MFIHAKLLCCAILTLSLVAFCAGNTARTCHTCAGINCQRTSSSVEQLCEDPLDICVTIFEKFNVVQKGCLLEIPIELRQRCDTKSPECHKCNTDRCNVLGQDDYMCLQCDSSTDANCATAAANSVVPTRCPSPTAPNSYCYVKYANNVTQRGCAIAVEEQLSCYGDASCLLCLPGDVRGCNSVDFTPGSRANQF